MAIAGIVGGFSVDKAGDVAVNPNLANNLDSAANLATKFTPAG